MDGRTVEEEEREGRERVCVRRSDTWASDETNLEWKKKARGLESRGDGRADGMDGSGERERSVE